MPTHGGNSEKYGFSWLLYVLRSFAMDAMGATGLGVGLCVSHVRVWVGGRAGARALQKGGMDRISSYLDCPVPREV